ncbi:MAG: hypothetical protein IJ366_04340 [Clostridia bacterium]|nr:hypothetical protein [Clostridia bacterium]
MYCYETFHETLAQGLISNVRGQNPPHAYIFEGDSGLGIYGTARLFAAALACTGENEPCGICNSCIGAKADSNPDIITVAPEDKKKSIGVEVIRDMIGDAYVKPFLARRKVYIFPDAGIVTEPAQNAFLKLLEEPPDYAVFILIADNADLLLETIRSRCVKVRFSPLSEQKMTEYVEKLSPNDKRLGFIVRYSGGIPEKAAKIISDEGFDALRTQTVRKLPELFSQRRLSAYSICDFVEENKDNAPLIFTLWEGLVRDIILIHNGSSTLITNSDYETELRDLAMRVDEKSAMSAAESIMLAEEMQRRYVNLRALTLKMALSISAN